MFISTQIKIICKQFNLSMGKVKDFLVYVSSQLVVAIAIDLYNAHGYIICEKRSGMQRLVTHVLY